MNTTFFDNSTMPDFQEPAILIIDDSPTNLGVIAGYLEEFGLEILVARTGESGLEKAQLAHPDLILLDVVLPGIDGFETCRRLKENETTKNIPIIFMTVLTEAEHKIKGFQVGAVDYITKPFQKEEVLVRVTTHLRLRELTEQLEQKVQERTRELTIANQRLKQEIAERKQAENLLRIQRDLALALSAESNMKKVADQLLEHLLQIEEFDCGGVYLVDEATGALDLVAHTGLPRQFVESAAHYEADAPQTRLVMEGTSIYRSYDKILPGTKNQVRRQEGLRMLAVIPVFFEGQVLAALNLASHTYHEIPIPVRNTLEAMATTHIGEVLARVKVETALQTLNAELEQRVIQRTAELEAANRELKDFAYVVSHDLKAPLRGISRLAQWLVADYTDAFDEQGKEMIELLVGRVKRMDNLIEGILHYSRVGRLIGKDKQIDLNTLVKDVIDMLAAPEHIQISFENELPAIIGDKIRIAEVFQNLLSNAIEFMDKADGKITIGCVDEGSHWKFSVADNGPGIDERYHEKIFQMFQTLTPRDKHESTGIGLALVKKIVELHGGKIWVESTVGEGSVFWFTLPKKNGSHHS